MRASLLARLAAAALIVPSIGAAQPATNQASDARAATAAQNAPVNPNARLLTPQQQGRQDLVHGPAEQPFRDFNVVRSKIPPVLIAATIDAYARPAPADCSGIAAQVHSLDEALGPDLDEPVSTKNPGLMARSGGQARGVALDAMRTAASDAIPFHDWIRLLTGAERHDRLVMAAIAAGGVRRAYLKGLGEAHSCLPPGVPRHLAHPANLAAETPPAKPR